MAADRAVFDVVLPGPGRFEQRLGRGGRDGRRDTAKALAASTGTTLSLDGLTTLDTDLATALAAAEKWNGTLSPIVALGSPGSIAMAKAPAARKGRLALPQSRENLPQTLSALIEKRDVEIPLIETLEFLQEPDGSLTEDFIIAEWPEERQKQKRAAQAAD